jgi:hypothetical protein
MGAATGQQRLPANITAAGLGADNVADERAELLLK